MSVVQISKTDQIATVRLDNPPVNATSTALRAELLKAVHDVQDCRAAILIGAGKVFVAGGDMTEFDRPAETPHLPDVLQAIEDSATPFIAAMHGMVLGGGFELAMSCAWRIAAPGTRFGLPEVNVGLIPGAGGSQRAPRLLGMEAAIDMACSGQMLDATRMLDLGGIDAIADGDLLDAAQNFAQDLPARPTPVSAQQVEALSPEDYATTEARLKKRARGQQSPLHNLAALQWAALPFAEGQPKERALHLDLRQSAESRALRHAFFAERSVARPRAIHGATPRDFSHIAVVGGGLMGAGIATSALGAGLRVTLIERDAEAASAAKDRVNGLIEGGVTRGKISAQKAQAQRDALTCTSDYADASAAQIAIEAVFEDLDVKRAVFRDLAQHCAPDAILATNTSYIDPREIFAGISGQDRCIGLHFFSPAHVMKLLEIVQMPETAPEVIATGFALGKRMRKISVLSGICDGFIGNRMLAAYRRAADYLLADGALPAQIDAAMRDAGMPMGPYELQDLTGLQIAWANRKRQAASRPASERYVGIADRLCEAGRLGQRAGKGWYRYDEGDRTPHPDPEVTAIIESYSAENELTRRDFAAQEISDRLLAVLANEGAQIVAEGIAEDASAVDMVKIHGYGFPRRRGGPMHLADQTGWDKIAQHMRDLEQDSPGSWQIAPRP